MTALRPRLALLVLVALAGCPGACPPPQVTYPSGVTGVVCRACYAGDHCDPALLPAEQVDQAAVLVARDLADAGTITGQLATEGLRKLHVCLVDLPGMQAVPGSWASGPCTTLDVPGTCLAGQQFGVSVKVTVRNPSGVRLKVWETALAHEIAHAFGLMEGELMSGVIARVNAELQRRFP